MASSTPRYLQYLAAAIVFAIALGMRIGAVNQTSVDIALRADARDYYSYALNLKHYATFSRQTYSETTAPPPDAVRTPGYPAFLAPLVDYPPDEFMLWRVTLVQAVLDSLTVLLALGIFRRLLSERWALAAALLTALSPHLIVMTTYVLSETLFIFLTLLSLWLLIRMREADSRKLALAAGALIACAALTRPTLQYFVVPLAGMLLLTGWRRNLKLALPLLLGFVLVFTPWQLRNLYQTGQLSEPSLTINAYHHGMYPDFRYQDRPETTGFPYRYNPRNIEFSTSKDSVLAEIRRRFREEPARHLKWYLLGKPVTLLSWNVLAGMGDIFVYPVSASPYLSSPLYVYSRDLMKALHWPLVVLALVATVAAWLPVTARRLADTPRFAARLLSLLMLYFIALHIVAAPFPRYGIPLRPVIYGLAMLCCAQGIAFLAARLGQPRTRPGQA
jgi:4-amino-4-deoxy-L-arabinose transferase-like glycosyltransferase